jgi:hypothetical protein
MCTVYKNCFDGLVEPCVLHTLLYGGQIPGANNHHLLVMLISCVVRNMFRNFGHFDVKFFRHSSSHLFSYPLKSIISKMHL